jgi:hypothetical protein
MVLKAEDFLVKIKLLINQISNDKIDVIRNAFENL